MDNVGYVSLSAQIATRQELNVVANNVANINTTGFKSDKMIFSEYVSQAGEKNARPVSFVQDKATWTSFEEGTLIQTGSQLNVAISGEGFLGVETENGIQYTRDGRLFVNPEGTLVNNEGLPIINMDGAQIQIPAGDNNLTIGKDGVMANNSQPIGRLGVFNTEVPESLIKVGNLKFNSPIELEPMDNPNLIQGSLEGSNVNGVREVTRMIDITRSYSQATTVIENIDNLAKETVARIGRV